MSNERFSTLRQLSDGSYTTIYSTDPDVIARKVKEAELAIVRKNKIDAETAFKASPEYQPGATLEKEDIGFAGKVGRGSLAGLIDIPTGVTSTVGYGLQAAGFEEVGEDVVARAEAVKQKLAPDIEGMGLAAEIPKALIQFGIPGGLVLKAMKNSNSATKLVAVSAAEGLVAEEDMKTFGDSFIDGGPTKTQELEFLDGQEKAFAALYNKGKVGLETAAMLAGIPLVLTGSGLVLSTTSKAAAQVPGVKQIAEGVYEIGEDISTFVKEIEKRSPLANKILSSVRFRGALPDKTFAEIKAAKAAELGALTHANAVALKDIDNALKTVFKKGEANGTSAETVIQALDDFLYPTDEILTTKEAIAAAKTKQSEAAKILISADESFGFVKPGKVTVNTDPSKIMTKMSLFRSASNARKTIDNYSEAIMRNPQFLPEDAAATLEGQLGIYGSRQYRAFIEDDFMPTKEAERKAISVLMESTAKADKPISESQAREMLFELIKKGKINNLTLKPKDLIEDSVLNMVQKGLLKNRTLDSKEIREFLGEYTGRQRIGSKVQTPEERRLGLMAKTKETVSRQSAIIAKGKYFTSLKRYNDTLPDSQKMFLDELPLDALQEGRNAYTKLSDDIGYGPLRGKYVKTEYLNALEHTPSSFGQAGSFIGQAYASYLVAKAISQKAVTVYNPTGQIRNVTSAMGFAIANGNIPSTKTIAQAVEDVFSDIGNNLISQPERKAKIENYSKRGLIGQQAQQGEIQSLIDDAVSAAGIKGKSFVGRVALKSIEKEKNNFANKLYQAGDDVWRIVNFETELKRLKQMATKAQLKNSPFILKATTIEQREIARSLGLNPDAVDLTAGVFNKNKANQKLREEFLEEESALITRDVVPNYSRVPTAIDTIRRLPLGNFVAYPSEIIRTSFNILGRAIKEMSSENAEMRARGIQRLMGFGSMTVGIPSAATAFGISMTGSSEDQLAAYKRSGAAPWDRNATLIPVQTDKDGNVLEVINASYTLPYDYMMKPFFAVLNAKNTGERSEAELLETAEKIGVEVLNEFLSPFLGESIITERILGDAFFRGGRTRLGSRIYNEDDPLGDKMYAGFFHAFNALIPAFSPVEFNIDKPIWEEAPITRKFQLADFAQSALVETGLLDPRFRVSERGRQLDFIGEMVEAGTGIKTIKTDMKRSLGYKAQEAKRELAAATEDYRALKKAYGPRGEEEFLDEFRRANERKYKAVRDLSIVVGDARLLGISDEEIAFILRKEVGGVGDWRALMNNTFIPYKPPVSVTVGAYDADKEKVRNVAPVGELLQELNKIYDRGQDLPPAPPPQPRAAPLTETFPEQIKETIESIPENLSGLYNRASRFLREQEEDKLMGGG